MRTLSGRTLSIDIETYSSEDLTKVGVYRYASTPDFRILLFGYAFDDDEVRVVDLECGEKLPQEVLSGLRDKMVVKSAFNANFERVCLSAYLKERLSPVSWHCSAVHAGILGLPLKLETAAEVLGLRLQKLKEGKELIRLFSVPCRHPGIPRYLTPNWQRFKEYCKRDVEVERAISLKLGRYPVTDKEKLLYVLDQEINDRGVLVDRVLVEKAVKCGDQHRQRCLDAAGQLAGIRNPNSVKQMKEWLSEKGVEVSSLSKKVVTALAEKAEGEVEALLDLRLQLSKTSIKKYEAMERAVCSDGRVRGLFQFYGANRTGRWAGRLVQVHNLPQNHMKDLKLARELLKRGSFEELEMLFGSIPGVLSELIRTAFIPQPGYKFAAADFSAVEARVIAWLPGEQWRMEVFRSGGKIYEASASRMFRVPVESISKDSPLRQKGKIAELALGYGGGAAALAAMGALESGLKREELKPLVNAWRTANASIVKFWQEAGRAALKAVKDRVPQVVGRIRFNYAGSLLLVTLPSGRSLAYVRPQIVRNSYGNIGIEFEGIGENKRWCRIYTYGAKLVENIVQGVSRDLLAEAMVAVHRAGYRIVLHVHDEIVAEVPPEKSLQYMCALMERPPDWAKGLTLKVDGFECHYYKKE